MRTARNRRRIPLSTITALLCLALAPRLATAESAAPDPRAEVLAAARAFSAALVRGDLTALGECYTESALLLPPGASARGRAAIREYFAPAPGRRQVAHELKSDELVIEGDLAVDSGTWISTVQRGDGDPQTDSERYLAVWRREGDGRWRMQFDMWHRPAPRPPAPVDRAAKLPASVPLPRELDRVLRDYEEAWRARDARKVAALFAEEGYVLSGGRPPVAGRAAIEQYYAGQGGPLFLRAFHFGVSGDTAFLLGGYAYAEGAPDDGKFTLTLRRGPGGRWLIVSDMDNPNRSR